MARFLPDGRMHLRGFHYKLSSAGDVVGLQGKPYINDDACWLWMSDEASKAARWLAYVPFSRISDERNSPPLLYLPDDRARYARLFSGSLTGLEIPDLESALPHFQCQGATDKDQPFRIILFGEKSSLAEHLGPIAALVSGEMILPTGESSKTLIAEMCDRASADDRPTVVLYFSDFDPSGRQMAISVARTIQALKYLSYPGLKMELHAVALTLEQVTRLGLPETPLKEEEKRRDRWKAAMGREQTEIDALLALRPDDFREIALEAVAPFFDDTLAERTLGAERAWNLKRST